MKLLLMFTAWMCASIVMSQSSKKELAIIKKIIDTSYYELPAQFNYKMDFECASCIFDSSNTYVGNIDGAIKNNEYILHHHPVSLSNLKESYKYLSTSTVTIAEYNEFLNWVRDSIAMEQLYFGYDIIDYELPYLIYSFNNKRFYKRPKKRALYFGEKSREEIRSLIHFDHTFELDYEDRMNQLTLATMYLPPFLRYMKIREFDDRKLVYLFSYPSFITVPRDTLTKYYPHYQQSNDFPMPFKHPISCYPDTYQIGNESEYIRDVHGVLAQLTFKTCTDAPVYGVRGFQANAFCQWKSQQLQRKFDALNLPYNVLVTLPTGSDSQQYPLPPHQINLEQKDYNELWQITNKEYLDFINAVKDSVMRERLYWQLKDYEKANKYLNYVNFFMDEDNLDFVDFDPAERYENRYKFSLNYKTALKKKDPSVDSILNTIDYNNLIYKYCEIDSYKRSLTGLLAPGYPITTNEDQIDSSRYRLVKETTLTNFGKESIIGFPDVLGEPNAIRIHADPSKFYVYKETNIVPINSIYPPNNDELIQTISYEQALAFYNWKYPIHLVTSSSEWQDYIYPSKEQFLSVQKGEKVTFEYESITYSSPSFRYVVHLYRK